MRLSVTPITGARRRSAYDTGAIQPDFGRGKEVPMHTDLAQSAATRSSAPSAAATQAASDDALIQRIAAGNRLAMQVLFARHHVRVYRFVLRLVRDQTLAEDLVS